MKLPIPKLSPKNVKAFSSDLSSRAREQFRKKPLVFWVWVGAIVFVLTICVFLLYRIFFILPDILVHDAVSHNRRITIDLGSGDIVGGQHSQPAMSDTFFKTGKGTSHLLNPAPYETIAEATSHGLLPQISGGIEPWVYYGKKYASTTRNPQIAIIISDLGSQAGDIDEAIHLSPQLTFSLSPYVSRVQDLSDHLRDLGFETMINVPLQTSDYPYSDPGPYAVLAGNNEKTNLEALQLELSRFSGYVGGLAGDDEVLSGSDQAIPMMKEFSKRGIAFVYAKNEHNTRWDNMIFSNAWAGFPADIIIDKEQDPEHIKAALKLLIDTAKRQFFAVAIIHSYPVSLKLLQEWLPILEKQKLELVPFTTLAKQKYHVFEIREEAPPPPPKKKKSEEEIDPFAKSEKKHGGG